MLPGCCRDSPSDTPLLNDNRGKGKPRQTPAQQFEVLGLQCQPGQRILAMGVQAQRNDQGLGLKCRHGLDEFLERRHEGDPIAAQGQGAVDVGPHSQPLAGLIDPAPEEGREVGRICHPAWPTG